MCSATPNLLSRECDNINLSEVIASSNFIRLHVIVNLKTGSDGKIARCLVNIRELFKFVSYIIYQKNREMPLNWQRKVSN